MKVALALYTLREYTAKNFAEVLEKAAKLGYEGVEFAGFGDVPADVMKGYLDQYGLAVTSCHMPLQQLEQGLDAVSYTHLDVYKRQVPATVWQIWIGPFIRETPVWAGARRAPAFCIDLWRVSYPPCTTTLLVARRNSSRPAAISTAIQNACRPTAPSASDPARSPL